MLRLNAPEASSSFSFRCSWDLPLLLILTFVARLCLCLDPSASVTIDQISSYSRQRECGKGCLQNNYNPGADIERVLGCTWNGCYCGTQYAVLVTSIITSCWEAHCPTDGILVTYDISTALRIYDSYCGIQVEAVTASSTAPGITSGTKSTNSLTSTTTNTTLPSQTSNVNGGATTVVQFATPTSKSSGSSSLSAGGIIAIGVSVICSVLGLAFGVGFKIWKHRQAQKKQVQQT